MGRWTLGRSVTRRIAALEVERDHEELTRLSVEVLYGDPVFVHGVYLVAFARQVAVPRIAQVLYRGGGGDILGATARRNDDTLTFFGEFLRRGPSSPLGREAIARMEEIHGRFPISDEDKRYTLASLMFEADRIADHLGVEAITGAERQARWRFWRGVAAQMPLGGLPDTREEFLAWTHDYERERFGFTQGGRAIVDGLFEDWATRWFPRPMRPLGRQFLLALMDERLRAAHRLEDPHRGAEIVLRAGAQAYFASTPLRPVPRDRSWVDYFGRRHGPRPDFERVGYQPAAR